MATDPTIHPPSDPSRPETEAPAAPRPAWEAAGAAPTPAAAGPAVASSDAGVTSTGLDPAVAGLLAYALGWVSGLVLFLLEKDHRPTRFHAAQSLVLFGGATVFWVALSSLVWVPLLGLALAVVGLLAAPIFLGLWIFLMVRAYQQADLRLPVIAGIADRLVGG